MRPRGKNNRAGIWVSGAVQSQCANVSRIDRKASKIASSEKVCSMVHRSFTHRSTKFYRIRRSSRSRERAKRADTRFANSPSNRSIRDPRAENPRPMRNFERPCFFLVEYVHPIRRMKEQRAFTVCTLQRRAVGVIVIVISCMRG